MFRTDLLCWTAECREVSAKCVITFSESVKTWIEESSPTRCQTDATAPATATDLASSEVASPTAVQSQAMHLHSFQTSQAATAWREECTRGTDASHTSATESGKDEASQKATLRTFLRVLSTVVRSSLDFPPTKENLQASQSGKRSWTLKPGQLYALNGIMFMVQRSWFAQASVMGDLTACRMH